MILDHDAYRVCDESDATIEQAYSLVTRIAEKNNGLPVTYYLQDHDDARETLDAFVKALFTARRNSPGNRDAQVEELAEWRDSTGDDFLASLQQYYSRAERWENIADAAGEYAEWTALRRAMGEESAGELLDAIADADEYGMFLANDALAAAEHEAGEYRVPVWIAPYQEINFNTAGREGADWARDVRRFLNGESSSTPRWEPMDHLFASQGYTVEDLADEGKVTASPFLGSVRSEVCNAPETSLMLIVLVSVDTKQLAQITAGDTLSTVLPRDVVVGLYDPANGGGSLLGVELERDWELTDVNLNPSRSLDASPVQSNDHGYGFSNVAEVYGMASRVFLEPSSWDVV